MSSASRPSASVVKPTRSANRTETSLRSVTGAAVGARSGSGDERGRAFAAELRVGAVGRSAGRADQRESSRAFLAELAPRLVLGPAARADHPALRCDVRDRAYCRRLATDRGFPPLRALQHAIRRHLPVTAKAGGAAARLAAQAACRPEHETGKWSGRRGSNPRHAAWKAAALPAELLPPGRRRGRANYSGAKCDAYRWPSRSSRKAAGEWIGNRPAKEPSSERRCSSPDTRRAFSAAASASR